MKKITFFLLLLSFVVATGTAQAQLSAPQLNSPDNNATAQPTSLTLDWQSVTAATTYQVQLAADDSFSNPIVDSNTTTPTTSFDVSGLDHNTTYFWRVRASNGLQTSDWSTIRNFTTVIAPPVLVLPEDGSGNISTSPNLVWNIVDGAESYRLQLATNTDFSSPVTDNTGLSTTELEVSGLDNSTTYYWRVQASNNEGTSDWSATRNFTTAEQPPTVPTLISPSNGATAISTTPTLDWDSSNRANAYEVQLSTDSNFFNLVANPSGLTATEFEAGGLDNTTQYFWRVRASNGSGDSDWSSVRDFTTVEAAPPPPTLVSPEDNASDIDTDPTSFEWNTANRAETYQVQVATDSDFTNLSVNQADLTTTSFSTTALNSGTQYFWRVRASNEGGDSNFSIVRSFTTAGSASPPATPTLISPDDGAENISTNPTLDWNSSNGAKTYQVQIATDSNFSNLVANPSGLTATEFEAGGLDNSTQYFWRVRASNNMENSDWSNIRDFSTTRGAPATPTLSTPENGATGISISPTFQWDESTRAESYQLQVATDNNFNASSIIISQESIRSTSFEAGDLLYSKSYYWRVRAGNSSGTSNWSSTNSFVTKNIPQPSLVSPEENARNQPTDLTLNWNQVEGAVNYDVQVATDGSFANKEVMASDIPSDEFDVSNLEPDTRYFWRVRANSNSKTSSWSQRQFTTVEDVPAVPTLTEPVNDAASVPNNPTFRWNSAEGANTYTLQVSTTPDFRNLNINEKNVNGTSFEAGGLDFETTYYWRVNATNNIGTSDWSQTRNFTTEAPTAQIVVKAPNPGVVWNASRTQSIKWGIFSDQINSLRISYSLDNGNSWIVITESVDASDNQYSWALPNISSDHAMIRISDTNNSDIKAISDPFVIYPAAIDLQKTYVFNSAEDASDYQLIGLPARQGLAVEQVFSGKPKKDWNIYFDNGQESDFLVEYDGSQKFILKAGKAFWALSKRSVQISKQIQTITLQQDSTYSIPLHPGWNIISNPFGKVVSWASVQSLNNFSDPIWGFNRTFSQSTSFEPYKGYYFFNRNDLDSLSVPFAVTASGKTQTSREENEQLITLTIAQGDRKLSSIQIGFNPELARDPGKSRQVAPPGNFLDYNLHIISENTSRKNRLALEIRSEVGEKQTFPLRLKAKPGKQIQFHIKGLHEVNSHEVYLVSERTGKFYDLWSQSQVWVRPEDKISDYSLIIGTQRAIDSTKKKLKPETFTLAQNHPNPFNGQTVFEYSVAESGNNKRVKLTIYNILGRKITTLVNERQSSGFYEIRWSSNNLASGIYFYRLNVANKVLTKKFTLIK